MFPAKSRISTVADFVLACGISPVQALSIIDFRVDTDDVFFAGSLVEGFGNSLSDVDVLVVTECHRQHAIKLVQGTTRWIDVVYIGREELAAYETSVPDLPAGFSDWGRSRPASLSALDVLHDIAWGLRVSRPWRASLTILEDKVKSKISRSWMLTNIVSARARWHDASGALKDGQHLQAIYLRSLCLDFCVDAYTGFFGETDINVKWRWAKLARLARSGQDVLGFYDAYTRRGSVDGFSWAEVAALLCDVISLFVKGTRFDLPTPERDGERFEIACGRWVRVDIDGFSHEIATPLVLR